MVFNISIVELNIYFFWSCHSLDSATFKLSILMRDRDNLDLHYFLVARFIFYKR